MPKAEIMSIGTELLMGEITDTNSRFLATELQILGIELTWMTTSGDSREVLCDAFRRAIERADLVIASGGLGPTEDDITRDCLAEVLDEKLTVDAKLEKELRDFFAVYRRGRIPEHNIRQAMLIPSALPVHNAKGTAPGWWVEKNGKIIILVPGPPREMEPMWRNFIKPQLLEKFPDNVALTRTLKVFGMAEATVDEAVDKYFHLGNPELGIYAKPEGVLLRLICRGENAATLNREAEKGMKEILGEHVWGYDEDTLPGIVSDLLLKRNLRLAAMDAGTGGAFTDMLNELKSAHHFFLGSIETGSSSLTEWNINVGTNSEDLINPYTAELMAKAARDRFHSDIGLGITGISGIAGNAELAGAAFIAIADNLGAVSWKQTIIPRHDLARNQLAVSACFRLRQRLLGIETGF